MLSRIGWPEEKLERPGAATTSAPRMRRVTASDEDGQADVQPRRQPYDKLDTG